MPVNPITSDIPPLYIERVSASLIRLLALVSVEAPITPVAIIAHITADLESVSILAAVVFLVTVDLVHVAGSTVVVDLAHVADLAVTVDLAHAADLAVTADLAHAADLVATVDLVHAAALVVTADLDHVGLARHITAA